MAVLSGLLNKVFCCPEKEPVPWQGGRDREMERERDTGRGILRRSKGNRGRERMSETARETPRRESDRGKISGEHGGVRTMTGKGG